MSAQRAVVTDDAHAIRLSVYRGAELAAAAEVPPLHALAIAGELIAAAARHLGNRAAASRRKSEQ